MSIFKTYIFTISLLFIQLQLYSDRPNILLFLCDDMGLSDAQVYSPDSSVPTPNINKLAQSGTLFWDGHAAASVCTPSRYSILSGCYPFRSKPYPYVIRSSYDDPIFQDERETLPQMMQRAGYKTAAFGKWHLGMNWIGRDGKSISKPGVETSNFSTRDIDFTKPIQKGPLQLGFDYFFGIGSSINHGPYTFIENDHVVDIPTTFRKEIKQKEWGGPFREGWISNNWKDSDQGITSAQKALDFIEQHQKDEKHKPFFIYYSASANHWPYVPPISFKNTPILGQGGNRDNLPYRNDMIFENDLILGELIAKLKDPNKDGNLEDSIYENTMIIFTSDNGADKGYHKKIKGKKGQLFEGGHRVPLIVSWPQKVKPDQVSYALFSAVDFYASFAALTKTDIKPKSAVDSQNCLAALLGNDLKVGRASPLLHEKTYTTTHDEYALRQGKYKLLKSNNGSKLFNLDQDLLETKDISKSKPEITQKLIEEAEKIISSHN